MAWNGDREFLRRSRGRNRSHGISRSDGVCHICVPLGHDRGLYVRVGRVRPAALAGAETGGARVLACREERDVAALCQSRTTSALSEAGRAHTIETYQAKHKSAIRDTLAYDAAAVAPNWSSVLSLLRAAIAACPRAARRVERSEARASVVHRDRFGMLATDFNTHQIFEQ